MSSNKKMLQMQEYMQIPMQLSAGSPQYGYITAAFLGSTWWQEINL